MCLRDQGIDDNNGSVGRVRRPTDSSTTTEASVEDKKYMTRTRDLRQQQRRQGIDNRTEESTTTAEASTEEDRHEDYNNDNICVGGR